MVKMNELGLGHLGCNLKITNPKIGVADCAGRLVKLTFVWGAGSDRVWQPMVNTATVIDVEDGLDMDLYADDEIEVIDE